jgi:CDP-diacylglycerol--serine O-phosphatidyltransferase
MQTILTVIKATSDFGAQLDSLMDLINFGVCPGIVLYIWGLDKLGWAGFLVSLIYVASMVRIKFM